MTFKIVKCCEEMLFTVFNEQWWSVGEQGSRMLWVNKILALPTKNGVGADTCQQLLVDLKFKINSVQNSKKTW